MRFLLINPASSNDKTLIYNPIGLMILDSIIKETGNYSRILDLDYLVSLDKIDKTNFFEEALRIILESSVDYIGFTTNCLNYPIVMELAKKIKEKRPQLYIFLGGPHASMTYEETLKTFDFIDLIVVGEGENTIKDLLKNNFRPSERILGISFREGEDIVFTGERGLIHDLDQIPRINYKSLKIKEYWNEMMEVSSQKFQIEIGRGCPCDCSFCSTSVFWKRKYRVKSVERVISEIKELYFGFGIDKFEFIHDNLTVNQEYCEKLCTEIENAKLKITWECNSRIDQIDEDLIGKLKNAGCKNIFFGIETGSIRLQKVIKKNINLKSVKSNLRMVISHGIKPITSFILGYPDETEEELNQTLHLGLECAVIGSSVFLEVFSPIVKTELYNKNKDRTEYSEYLSSRLWIDPKKLDIYNFIRNNRALFSFFYSCRGDNLENIEIFLIFFVFIYLINNYPEQLQEYLFKNKYLPFDLIRKKCERNKLGDFSKQYNKIDFFNYIYECYSNLVDCINERVTF